MPRTPVAKAASTTNLFGLAGWSGTGFLRGGEVVLASASVISEIPNRRKCGGIYCLVVVVVVVVVVVLPK